MNFKLVFLEIFLMSMCFLGASEIEQIDERLQKLQVRGVGRSCFVPWKDRWCAGQVLAADNDQLTVRVCDDALPIEKWPLAIFNVDEVRGFVVGKHTSMEELIAELKNKSILVSPRIEEAFRTIDRAYFAPRFPYFDTAIDIGCKMCISAPHIHVRYLELVKDQFETATAILDVGAGTGYLAAMLAELSPHAKVTGIDCYKELVQQAEKNCINHLPKSLNNRLNWVVGNGLEGCPKNGPYDIIVVGFMCKDIPYALLEQLKPGGTMIIPVGNRVSSYDERLRAGPLYQVKKDDDFSYRIYQAFLCSFIPSQVE